MKVTTEIFLVLTAVEEEAAATCADGEEVESLVEGEDAEVQVLLADEEGGEEAQVRWVVGEDVAQRRGVTGHICGGCATDTDRRIFGTSPGLTGNHIHLNGETGPCSTLYVKGSTKRPN